MLCGIIKPRIIIPPYVTDDGSVLRYVLLHEGAHMRRGDNITRIIALAIACIHWFNPLVWLYVKAFLSDCEIACDEKVLRSVQAENREYAQALLACEYKKANHFSAFGGADIRTRITRILSYRKVTTLSTICFALFILSLAAALLTNAA